MPQWLSSCRPGSAYPSAQRGGSLCSQAFYHLGHSKETQRRRHQPSRNSCWRRLCRPFFYEWIWSHQLHTSRQTRLCTVDEQWSHRCLATNIDQPLWRGEDITLPTSTNHQLSPGRNPSTLLYHMQLYTWETSTAIIQTGDTTLPTTTVTRY